MDNIWILLAGFLLTVVTVYLFVVNSRQQVVSASQIQSSLSAAALAKQSSDFAQAIMLYERARDLIESGKPVDRSLLSACLVSYGVCLERTGQSKEARDVRSRLIDIWNQALQERDTQLMTEIDYLCSNAEFGSATIEVAQYYERVLAFRETAFSHSSDIFINTVVIYANLMRRLGEKDIADDLERHAEQLRKGGPKEFSIPDPDFIPDSEPDNL